MMNFKEKSQDAIGEAVVQGTKKSLKKDIQENWQEYAFYGACVIGAIAGVNILFNVINRPRATRANIHFYVHIV